MYGKSEAGVFGIGTGEAALRSAPAYSIESAYILNEFLGFGRGDPRRFASEDRRTASNSLVERSRRTRFRMVRLGTMRREEQSSTKWPT